MTKNILLSVKNGLGIPESVNNFDEELLLNINSSFSELYQLGFPKDEAFIADMESDWNSILGDNKDLEFIKTYVILSVKLLFDPPQASTVMDAQKAKIAEMVFRISVAVELGGES